MKTFKSLETRYPMPGWRLVGMVIIALIVGFFAWTQVAKLEEVSVLVGEVVPQDQVKVIQHLEGGIIKDVLVREGEVVKAGDPLMQTGPCRKCDERRVLANSVAGFARETGSARGGK